jgi:hypothetical protein
LLGNKKTLSKGKDLRAPPALRVANESVSMQAALPDDAPKVTFSLSNYAAQNSSLAPGDLQWLRERLQAAYGPVEAPVTARLTELVERLARREHSQD